jgi:hypothetical protein
MAQITIDPTLANKLHGLSEVVELCDPSGCVLGRFIPLVDLSEWEPVSPDISPEELDRRFRSQEKRSTTVEVLAHLESL